MDMQQAIRDLQEAAIVMADIQRRQASVQRIQAEELDTVRERQKRIETNLAEATDKLNDYRLKPVDSFATESRSCG